MTPVSKNKLYKGLSLVIRLLTLGCCHVHVSVEDRTRPWNPDLDNIRLGRPDWSSFPHTGTYSGSEVRPHQWTHEGSPSKFVRAAIDSSGPEIKK